LDTVKLGQIIALLMKLLEEALIEEQLVLVP
jgi:hypothetical protein